jgi:hypothetical protein
MVQQQQAVRKRRSTLMLPNTLGYTSVMQINVHRSRVCYCQFCLGLFSNSKCICKFLLVSLCVQFSDAT